MNVLLDELYVGPDGMVDVRIIPPDSLSRLSDVLASFEAGSQSAQTILGQDLPAIGAALGLRGRVKAMVDSGGGVYTVNTWAGESREVSLVSRPEVARLIQRIADRARDAKFGTPQIARVPKPRLRSRKPAVRQTS